MTKNSFDPESNVVEVDFSAASRSRAAKEQPILNEKKRLLFEKWLEHGAVSVLFDARVAGVKVPSEFLARGDLRFNFSYDFLVPDFNFNCNCVWATLSFQSGESFCMLPWAAIYGMQSEKLNQGAVWFESFPKDYDQLDVLGFDEEMCKHAPSIDGYDDDTSIDHDESNVVALNFSPENDIA